MILIYTPKEISKMPKGIYKTPRVRKIHKCSLCGKIERDKRDLNKHVEVCRKRQQYAHTCRYCPVRTMNATGMSQHMRKRHKNMLEEERRLKRQEKARLLKLRVAKLKRDRVRKQLARSRRVYSFDVETTGIYEQGNEIIQIAIAAFDVAKKEYYEVLEKKFLPQGPMTDSATEVNGWTMEKLEASKLKRFTKKDAAMIIETMNQANVVISYNTEYDILVLKQQF